MAKKISDWEKARAEEIERVKAKFRPRARPIWVEYRAKLKLLDDEKQARLRPIYDEYNAELKLLFVKATERKVQSG